MSLFNFGVSTTIWDRLFGTFDPTNEPATDYFFWSTIRSYCMKLACQTQHTCMCFLGLIAAPLCKPH